MAMVDRLSLYLTEQNCSNISSPIAMNDVTTRGSDQLPSTFSSNHYSRIFDLIPSQLIVIQAAIGPNHETILELSIGKVLF